MNPQLLLLLTTHNANDIKVIVEKVGIETLIQIAPNLMNIVNTIQGASK